MSGEDGNSDGAANSGGGITANLFTQDQVNHFAAEAKRGAMNSYFKDLGFDGVPAVDELKGALTKASEFDKLQQGQQSDVERLTNQLTEVNTKAERVPVLEMTLSQAQIAADAGLKSRYWKFVEGKTEDEIKASVQTLLDDLGQTGGSGAGDGDGDDGKASAGGLEANPQQGAGGTGKVTSTLNKGADAYSKRHKKE